MHAALGGRGLIMSDKESLELEAKQLEKSIAEAAAAGQALRAQKLSERRARVLARLADY